MDTAGLMSPLLGSLRVDVWMLPLLSLCVFNLLVLLVIEACVGLQILKGPTPTPRRHLLISQILMLFIFVCTITGILFVLKPSHAVCSLVRFGIGVGYSGIFATLLVKLISLQYADGGYYIPNSYHFILLFFIIAAQFMSSVQDSQFDDKPGAQMCVTQLGQCLSSLLYNIFLLMCVAMLSIRTRKIYANHRESLFIGISAVLSYMLWLAWVLAAYTLPPRYTDACIAFGLVLEATITLLVTCTPRKSNKKGSSSTTTMDEILVSQERMFVPYPVFHLGVPAQEPAQGSLRGLPQGFDGKVYAESDSKYEDSVYCLSADDRQYYYQNSMLMY